MCQIDSSCLDLCTCPYPPLSLFLLTVSNVHVDRFCISGPIALFRVPGRVKEHSIPSVECENDEEDVHEKKTEKEKENLARRSRGVHDGDRVVRSRSTRCRQNSPSKACDDLCPIHGHVCYLSLGAV